MAIKRLIYKLWILPNYATILKISAVFIFCSSFYGCLNDTCNHTCGTPPSTHSISHRFGGGPYFWEMDSYWDFLQEKYIHKLTILKRQIKEDTVGDNSYYYDATFPKGETSIYLHTLDSITKLMQQADNTNLLFPTKNKQLIMKYFYFMLDIEPLDSMHFSKLINGIIYRKNELKKNNPNKWKQRIEQLNTLHHDIKDLYKGCSNFEYQTDFDNDKVVTTHLYIDQRNSTFIKLTFKSDTTVQLLFRPSHFHLLTRNEEIKEQCSCCDN